MGLKMKIFDFMGIHQFLRETGHDKQYIGGIAQKRRFGEFGGGLAKKREESGFEGRVVDTLMHTMTN